MVRPRTDLLQHHPDNLTMSLPNIRAIDTDRFQGDVIITFHNKRAAVFSAAFLYASLPHAQEIFASDFEQDDGQTDAE